jgi:hypothetical protein
MSRSSVGRNRASSSMAPIAVLGVRTLTNPDDPADMKAAHA